MDLKELVQISTPEAHKRAFLKDLTDGLSRCSKPIIAGVVGHAVGVPAAVQLLMTARMNVKKKQTDCE